MRRSTLTGVLGMLAAVLGAAVLADSAAAKADVSQTGGISSISPAVADRGGTVTITGNGFGGPNVKIMVGGVSAECSRRPGAGRASGCRLSLRSATSWSRRAIPAAMSAGSG